MREKKSVGIFIFILVSVLLFGNGRDEDQTLLLEIGNKNLKGKTMAVSAGKIYSAQKGDVISFSQMIGEMKTSHFIYIGESHDSLPMHEIQAKIIYALYKQNPKLAVGLEMFPVTSQEVLNKWALGLLTKDQFLRESKWYTNWNFNFGFYEDIFQFAKDNRLPVQGLNASRDIIKKIRMSGWESLSEEEKQIVPQPDLSNEEHRKLIRMILESPDMPHQMKKEGMDKVFEGLYRAQSAWDEVMAAKALKTYEREGGRVAVLAGSGHLIYNLGINRRTYEKTHLPFKTVICVVVPEREEVRVSRSLADYVWGVAEEEKPAFPSVGLSLKKVEGLENIVVESNPIDGAAKLADFKKGDIILTVDGKTFSDINELRIYLSKFKWGEESRVHLLRDAEAIDVVLRFDLPKKEESEVQKK